jgi:hypothetical protein
MDAADIFIGSKKVKLEGKTRAQLEHLLQQAQDMQRRYDFISRNYPPDRREKLPSRMLPDLKLQSRQFRPR